MKLIPLKVAFACMLFTSSLFSQRHCGTMEHHQHLQNQNPNLDQRRNDIELFTKQYVERNNSNEKAIINIPVVVHVVYNTTSQNISSTQIQSQIDILNKDFRKLNSDISSVPSTFSGVTADCEINFCLASFDPNGNATSGIVRKSTTITQFIDDDKVKFSAQGGDDAWSTSNYLNIWVCPLGNNLLGYAQFPGGPSNSDGVVINYTAFGNTGTAVAPFNKGRTVTHEVGHWLNLYHIGGDASGGCGNDMVADTPTQKGGVESDGSGNGYGQNYGCPIHPLVRSGECSGTSSEMFMNYMDYVDDACMYMFTNGQKSRMQALFTSGGARASLLSSSGCSGSTTPTTPSFCSSSATTSQYEWISNVKIGSINNSTTSGVGYNDYTSLSTNLTTNNTYSINLTPAYSGSVYNEYFVVYIDYNNDKDFEDAGEKVFTSTSTTSMATGTFTIPSSTTTGTKRMRIIMSDAAISSSCGSYNYGETEDYSVNISSSLTVTCSAPTTLAPTTSSSSATVSWNAVSGATGYSLQYKASTSTSWTTISTASTSYNLTNLTAGTTYNWQVATSCSGSNSSYTTGVNFTIANTSCTDNYETNESRSAAKLISVNNTISAKIGTSTDIDWFKFSNTTTAKNIKITLSNLPADYDLRLYNGSGTLLKSSTSTGLNNEVIIYNTTTVTTYYLKVTGYNGANSTSCYSLNTTISSTALRTNGNSEDPIEEEESITEEISIYPNPFNNGNFNFTLKNEYLGTLSIKVLDTSGRIIYSKNEEKEDTNIKSNIQLENFESGVFYVQINGDNFSIVKKIISLQ